ncbi:MAG: cysteine desulfurase [Gemmatimonadota bacterium]
MPATTVVQANPLVPALDVARVRGDFPILASRVHGRPLVYLDNAATSQKPTAVLEALSRFYTGDNANIHRGVHQLSERATDGYEAARKRIQRFLGAESPEEIVFVRGTTDAVNLVAQAFARPRLCPGDEILVTVMEHHSNFVPWQLVAEQTGAIFKVAPVDGSGDLDLERFSQLLTSRTRIVALTHVSNALGTVNPVRRIAELTHQAGAVVVLDAAQSIPHTRVDVQALGCDFLACSGHKMLGPTGIGVLYGRRELLESMPPYQVGGGMIERVTAARTTFAPPPGRFEAGTPPIAQAIGLAAAADYLEDLGMDTVEAYENRLVQLALEQLGATPGVRLVGTPRERMAVVSFTIDGAHPHDVATILDQEGIAVRAGHHCTQPLMDHLGLTGTVRASFSFYNLPEDVHALVRGIARVREVFG